MKASGRAGEWGLHLPQESLKESLNENPKENLRDHPKENARDDVRDPLPDTSREGGSDVSLQHRCAGSEAGVARINKQSSRLSQRTEGASALVTTA